MESFWVYCRVLRGFADQGWVQSSRGSIEVLDAAALRRVAAGLQGPVT